jgi:tetratricopeptide (TPR) repeat protein
MNYINSIAKLLIDENLIGTAWLIEHQYAITAAHCIDDGIENVTLSFPTIQSPARLIDKNAHLDVALLKLEQPQSKRLQPLAIGKCSDLDMTDQANWLAHGYPGIISDRFNTGITIGGEVRNFYIRFEGVHAIQLLCKEGVNDIDFKAPNLGGMSGAPVILQEQDNRVVGIIRYAPPEFGESILVATPIDVIVDIVNRSKVVSDKTVETLTITPLPSKGPIFVGREDEIESIRNFFDNKQQHIYLLIGLGGVGKTTLLANVIEGHVKDSSFFYEFSQNKNPSVDDILANLTNQYQNFNIPTNTSVEKKINVVINTLVASKRHYFFFEDLHNVLDENHYIQDGNLKLLFNKLFCSQSQSKILITSRIRLSQDFAGIPPTGTMVIKEIEGLSENDIYRFLNKLSECSDCSNQILEKIVPQLYTLTEGNPLAINLLLGSKWLKKTLQQLKQEIVAREMPITRFLRDKFWEQLFKEVMTGSQESEWAFLKVATIHRAPISESVFQQHLDDDLRLLDRLEERHLLTCGNNNDTYRLHELVKEYLNETMSLEEKIKIHGKAAQYYESLKKEGEPKNIKDIYEEAEAVYHYFEAQQYEKAASTRLSGYYRLWGMYETNLKMWEKVTKHLKDDKLVICYLEMGLTHFELMLYDKAKQNWSDSLKAYKKIENKNSLDNLNLAACLFDFLGELYRVSEDNKNALKYYLKSGKFLEKTENRSGGLGRIYNNIGLIFRNNEKYDKALEYYKKAQASCQSKEDNQGLAVTLVNIAEIHREKENYDEALNYYVKAKENLKRIGDKLGLADVYNNIALVYISKNYFDNSLRHFIKSKELLEQIDDNNKVSQLQLTFIHNNMGGTYFFQGKYDEAWECYQESKKICEQINDEDKLAIILDNISIVRRSRKLLPNTLGNEITFLY